MTTRKKCFELAKEHGIEIRASKNYYGWGCDLFIPDGYTLEDFDGARTGLTFDGAETAKEFWRLVYSDIKTCIVYKPWHKIQEK